MLDKAYKLANDRDLDRIKYLKMEGNPNTWDEMLGLYGSLKNRQASVRRVFPFMSVVVPFSMNMWIMMQKLWPPNTRQQIIITIHGKKLMENKTKESYRQAYYEFRRAQDYSGDSYPDLDQLITQTHELGISRVLVSSMNKTILNLPADFMDGLVAVNANELNSEWVEYYTRKMDKEPNYDYYIDIILQNIDVSPDLVQDKDVIEKKTVDNGFEYVLDSKGNVMRDTAGNDIKVKKYKEIQCTVIETHQLKDCNIKGEIEFSSANPQSLMKKQPIGAVMHFEHVSARAIGDVNALTPESKQLIEMKPMPFPDDIRMVVDCTEALKKAINEAIQYNRGILQ